MSGDVQWTSCMSSVLNWWLTIIIIIIICISKPQTWARRCVLWNVTISTPTLCVQKHMICINLSNEVCSMECHTSIHEICTYFHASTIPKHNLVCNVQFKSSVSIACSYVVAFNSRTCGSVCNNIIAYCCEDHWPDHNHVLRV